MIDLKEIFLLESNNIRGEFRLEDIVFDKLPTKAAEKKYNMKFRMLKDGSAVGYGDSILIALWNNSPVGWFLYEIDSYKDEETGESYVIATGMYVIKGMRNRGIGKLLSREIVKILDKKLGRGKYIFNSDIVTQKGKRLLKYRLDLTGNPDDHGIDWDVQLSPTY